MGVILRALSHAIRILLRPALFVYRAQADALIIEVQAKRRLADEYQAAQARGEVARHGGETSRFLSTQRTGLATRK
jgi:hypothetical protein